jgi:hypothetical protein
MKSSAPPTPDTVDEAHHGDNQRRFIELEKKMDVNTALTEKLASDTADLLEMWKDAGVFFKWMRKAGSALISMGKAAAAIAAIWAAIKYGNPSK